MDYHHNSSLTDDTSIRTTETIDQSKFFIDYHSHSLQLVDALQVWAKKVRFTSCKYEQGFFDRE
jgi:hypothetical protein